MFFFAVEITQSVKCLGISLTTHIQVLGPRGWKMGAGSVQKQILHNSMDSRTHQPGTPPHRSHLQPKVSPFKEERHNDEGAGHPKVSYRFATLHLMSRVHHKNNCHTNSCGLTARDDYRRAKHFSVALKAVLTSSINLGTDVR